MPASPVVHSPPRNSTAYQCWFLCYCSGIAQSKGSCHLGLSGLRGGKWEGLGIAEKMFLRIPDKVIWAALPDTSLQLVPDNEASNWRTRVKDSYIFKGPCVLIPNSFKRLQCTGYAPGLVWAGQSPLWGLSGKTPVIAYVWTWKIRHRVLAWSQTAQVYLCEWSQRQDISQQSWKLSKWA